MTTIDARGWSPDTQFADWIKDVRAAKDRARSLRQLRLERGMSQKELAAKAGVDTKTINRIENGRHVPTLANAGRICRALDVQSLEVAEFTRAMKERQG